MRQRHVSLRLELDDIGDMAVPLRPEALSIALHNLIDNALRYSPEGSTISVGVLQEVAQCRIWVSDQGPGMSEEDLEQAKVAAQGQQMPDCDRTQ